MRPRSRLIARSGAARSMVLNSMARSTSNSSSPPCARYSSGSPRIRAMPVTKVSNSGGQALDPECSAPCHSRRHCSPSSMGASYDSFQPFTPQRVASASISLICPSVMGRDFLSEPSGFGQHSNSRVGPVGASRIVSVLWPWKCPPISNWKTTRSLMAQPFQRVFDITMITGALL